MKRTPLKRKTPMKRTGKPLARSRLTPVSKDPKKRRENAAYEAAKRKWRKGHDGRCEMLFVADSEDRLHRSHLPIYGHDPMVHRCWRPADKNPHHMKGRGRFLSDISTFCGLCLECHRWVDTHRKQAVALGYFTYVNPNPDKPNP